MISSVLPVSTFELMGMVILAAFVGVVAFVAVLGAFDATQHRRRKDGQP